MKNIFLLGAYGQNNLGDDALLEVFLEQFSTPNLIVNSAQPARTSQRYGVETVATYAGWPRFRRIRALGRTGTIVFGGGSLLKEIEGGPIARLCYFLRIFALLLFGKLFNRPTAMLGVGMGPLDRPLNRLLARHAANLTDLICVRDTASRELLVKIGVRQPIHVTADPVFLLAPDETTPELQSPQLEEAQGSTRTAGVSSGADHPKIVVIPRYSLTDAHKRALAEACDQLVEAYGARIQFLIFQSNYQERFDDATSAHEIVACMRHGDAVTLDIPETAGAALEQIGQATLVISARLHGLIFAALQGVAPVALDYEVKVRSFMREIGQEWASLSLPALEAGRLPVLLDLAWKHRASTAAAIHAKVKGLRVRAKRNFDLFDELTARPQSSRALGAGALLFASMTIVNAGNYIFNLILGRWLGPTAFADLSLIITLMLVVTLITSALQTVSARFSAIYAAEGDATRQVGLRRWLGWRAASIGAVFLAICTLGAPLWQSFFHTASYWPFIILGLCLPFYFAQGVDRGILQGQIRFGALSLTYQAEMWVRLVAAIGFVAIGWAVNGAVTGLALSIVGTWLVGFWALRDTRAQRPQTSSETAAGSLPAADRRSVLAFAGPVVAALIGQVLINNSDILIVKHFFPAEAAGHYAALALIGRIVFFATLSVVAAMFPIVAQKQQRGEPHRHLLWLALALVAAASLAVIGITVLKPELMVRLLFGAAYLPIAPLLWLYAIATMLYALANVVINYRLSAGEGGGSTFAILAGAGQVGGLWLFHSSLSEVVIVQIVLMIGLFAALLVWDWRLVRRAKHGKNKPQPEGTTPPPIARRPVFALRRRWRSLLLGGITLVVLLLMWQVTNAAAPQDGNPAQQQIKLILPSLRDSEAEHAAGAYIPGFGAALTLDLVRGPNSMADKSPAVGTRDWTIYLMGTFGPRLDAVPPDEYIAISVNFYDFDERQYHQLVIVSRAADVADSSKYTTWLEGQPFEQVTQP
jgi:polysaccharide pyruvyl transferase CsaB